MDNKNISPVGDTWEQLRTQIFTPEEIAESDLRVSLMQEMISIRKKEGITQKNIELKSGVKQPVIARMESGATDPQLTTVLKVLATLGKTLKIVDIEKKNDADMRERYI